MPFFDTHTHLDYLHRFTGESLESLVRNAAAADVEKILIVTVLARDFKTIENLTALYPVNLRYGVGLHPLYIKEHTPSDLDGLAQYLSQRHKRLRAVAEIGLERANPELMTTELWRKQCDFFEAQLQLAKQYRLPVNLHSRKSHEQLFAFLKRIRLPDCGVVHGFSGSYEQAKRFVDLGYKIGVGGTISYERANKTRQTIAKLPLDALLLETDSPDMPVSGFQGQPNRPERINQIFQALCELRTEPPEEIKAVIWQNSMNMFA
ncbi:deoxyribonuclease [Actinobacillus succinogenes]|uniref:TatD-related deoxyribonuclease n=1 Tax=Actinobacillus succinogenes (strain ATCC 55618 / DSM 22257 / CCUG 43843 / 130Z) TaxID=339671 RepID=A6VP73_ACTSZ|nr:TatD family hydrolase [Actinobacillus succinogenes]ABR74770.1 TatD-related deoxyribonuclease [Actinobacillus succinogenes 130Z]PHI40810.1 deoxyribonuclease [Actinobacillus succinogenes]